VAPWAENDMSTEEDIEFKLDFGAGNVVVLPSRCLRIAKEPSDCDICIEACPVSAISTKSFSQESSDDNSEITDDSETARTNATAILDRKLGVAISEDCIHCGVCVAACPLESLSTTKYHPKSFEKQISDKAAKLEGIALGCARALFGVPGRYASRAITVPCLAALSSEMWFYAAAIARDAVYRASDDDAGEATDAYEPEHIDTLKVYLPPLMCDGCPVNLCGDAEQAYLSEIAKAEAWGADNIELIGVPEELDPLHSARLMSTLGEATTGGKREAVEHLASSFMRSWQSAGDDLSLEKKQAEYLARKRKLGTRRPDTNHNAPRPFGKRSQRRRLMRLALEEQKDLVCDVELLSTGTIAALCTGCGNCIDACSLDARRKVSSNSALYFSKLPKNQLPKGEMAAISDQLCCLGCSACVMQCPTGACVLEDLSGQAFMNLRQT